MGRKNNIDKFYMLMAELESRLGGKRTLAECHGRMGWPRRGVYFFFEPGEYQEDGVTERVVRVGTHATNSGSKSTLWKRLRQHRGTQTSNNPFGGNHRGSVFRKHVGSALISREGSQGKYAEWGYKRVSNKAIRDNERPMEKRVSKYIRAMPFLWLEVEDDPGPNNQRGYLERNAIGLLSNWGKAISNAIDPPSQNWLGLYCDSEKVARSGLWNSDHVDGGYDPAFLGILERYIRKMQLKSLSV